MEISNQNKSIEEILEWYRVTQNSLDKNEELIKYLNDIVEDIKKYYRCCRWGYFVCENNGKKGDEITLLRAIYKDHDYTILSKNVLIEYDGVKNRYVKLFFLTDQK